MCISPITLQTNVIISELFSCLRLIILKNLTGHEMTVASLALSFSLFFFLSPPAAVETNKDHAYVIKSVSRRRHIFRSAEAARVEVVEVYRLISLVMFAFDISLKHAVCRIVVNTNAFPPVRARHAHAQINKYGKKSLARLSGPTDSRIH